MVVAGDDMGGILQIGGGTKKVCLPVLTFIVLSGAATDSYANTYPWYKNLSAQLRMKICKTLLGNLLQNSIYSEQSSSRKDVKYMMRSR